MSDDNNIDDLEVYNFQGNQGEEVPKTVEKLIVSEGVQVFPDELCSYRHQRLQEVTLPNNGLIKIGNSAFYRCQNLLDISIRSTVQSIGEEAFGSCVKLKEIDFDFSASSPPQLATICEEAFSFCKSLQRIKLPSSVTFVGKYAFWNCSALVEANLSTTDVAEISNSAFKDCSSLQTVSLPSTLERIGEGGFFTCLELVTVVVPLDSKAIKIGEISFHRCRKLANFVLPKDSTAEENSFVGCGLLQERYGNENSRIVAGLIERFENLPLHRMCYDHPPGTTTSTVEELRQRIVDQQTGSAPLLFDKFGMTPFHVLFSTIEPRGELLDVLLDSFPYDILKWKDANFMRPLDYLMSNWTDGTVSLVQRTLEKSMIDPLSRWGTRSWMEAMQTKVQEILAEEDNSRRKILCNEAYLLLEQYETVKATSILEMTLWKCKLQSKWTSDDIIKLQALVDREECRCLSGANSVIPHVTSFLGHSTITFLQND